VIPVVCRLPFAVDIQLLNVLLCGSVGSLQSALSLLAIITKDARLCDSSGKTTVDFVIGDGIILVASAYVPAAVLIQDELLLPWTMTLQCCC
jgi:hypothetical protein